MKLSSRKTTVADVTREFTQAMLKIALDLFHHFVINPEIQRLSAAHQSDFASSELKLSLDSNNFSFCFTDGNANPDSQAVKTNRSKSGNTSAAPSSTIRRIWSSPALMGQLLFFVCSWILFS